MVAVAGAGAAFDAASGARGPAAAVRVDQRALLDLGLILTTSRRDIGRDLCACGTGLSTGLNRPFDGLNRWTFDRAAGVACGVG